MKKIYLMICFTLASIGSIRCQEQAVTDSPDHILHRIYQKDQGIRRQMQRIFQSNDPDSIRLFVERMRFSDGENQRTVAGILAKGWPENLSDTANTAIFLVIDHADSTYQKRFEPLVKEAADKGLIGKSDWATLIDRILMRENKKQIYGTQTKMNIRYPEGTKVCYMWPIEDPENVDLRRQKIGLLPLLEYLRIVEEYTGQPVVWDKQLSVEDVQQ